MRIQSVPGLRYVGDYVDAAEQTRLLAAIDAHPWMTDLKRRVQHYGYRYDYKARKVTPEMYLGDLPGWARTMAERLHADGYAPEVSDQVIVNEYHPGQGIAAHIDCEPCFGDTILSLSLGSACVMVFSRDDQKVDVPLEPGSLVVMQGEARHEWKHAIPARKSDRIDGHSRPRQRRVSITLRKVVI